MHHVSCDDVVQNLYHQIICYWHLARIIYVRLIVSDI